MDATPRRRQAWTRTCSVVASTLQGEEAFSTWKVAGLSSNLWVSTI